MRGTLEVVLQAYLLPSYQHCTDEAQKAVKSLQLTPLLVEGLPEDFLRQAFVNLGEIALSSFCFSFCCSSGLLFYFFGGVLLSPLLGLSLQLCLVV